MANKIDTRKARSTLALLWCTAALILFALVIWRSMIGKYGSNTERAWSLFLPSIMPCLSLIIAFMVYDIRTGDGEKKSIDRRWFRIIFWFSAFYLLLVLASIVLYPLSGEAPTVFMEKSNLWLGPIQGLVTAGIGVLFMTK